MDGLASTSRERVASTVEGWGRWKTALFVLSKVPFFVVTFALISWLFATNSVFTRFETFQFGTVIDPVRLTYTMFLSRGWETFVGNLQLWLPFGIALTLLTNNRHVLAISVGSYVLTQILLICIVCNGYGMNVVLFAVIAGTLFRTVGILLSNQPESVLEDGLVAIAAVAILVVFVFEFGTGGSFIGNTAGFAFGAGIEILWVIRDYGGSTSDRTVRDTTLV
jgi:hypothetical protein